MAALGAGLEKLQALTSLNFDFRYCWKLADELQKAFDSRDEFLAVLRGVK